MARTSKKSVYERIEEKLQTIKETEELLAQLNDELQELYTERDSLQMSQLFEAMKTKGLDIDEAQFASILFVFVPYATPPMMQSKTPAINAMIGDKE